MATTLELIAKIAANVEKITSAVDGMADRIVALEQELASLKPGLEDLDTKITALAGKMGIP